MASSFSFNGRIGTIRVVLLAIALVISLAACAGPPAATPTPEPTADESGKSPNTVQGYARECGRIMARDVTATGEKGERDFVEWTRELGRLAPRRN